MTSRSWLAECAPLAAFLREDPLWVVDGGAANGFDAPWVRHASTGLLRCHGFEPDEGNFARLKPAPSIEYHRLALSQADGTATLWSWSTNSTFIRRTDREAFFGERPKPVEVPTRALASLRRDGTLGSLDALKLDVEGHELHVLAGAGAYLADEMLYLKAEFSFRRGEGNEFAGIDAVMQPAGFMLCGLSLKQSSWGELQGGDLVYIRDPNLLGVESAARSADRRRAMKLAAIALALDNPELARLVAALGAERGLMTSAEREGIDATARAHYYAPFVLPGFPGRNAVERLLGRMSHIASGYAGFTRKSSPKSNQLDKYRYLFLRAGLIPSSWRRRHDRAVEREIAWLRTSRPMGVSALPSAEPPGRD